MYVGVMALCGQHTSCVVLITEGHNFHKHSHSSVGNGYHRKSCYCIYWSHTVVVMADDHLAVTKYQPLTYS